MFILKCDGCYALQKRPASGLLADLWQFPNVEGSLTIPQAMAQADRWQVHPRELLQQLNRTHIFTLITWNMQGIYMEVSRKSPEFQWFTAQEIKDQAALPTAFRQFFIETTQEISG